MSRMHPPDILHTVIHGSMEYCLGFSLQVVQLIASIDKKSFGLSPKLLEDSIRSFPACNALHPVRHVKFENVWDLVPSSNSKEKGKSTLTTKLILMKEYFKIPSAFFQVLLCCSNPLIVPDSIEWSKNVGFEEPYFNPMQVIVNSLFSMLIVYWYLHAPSLTENQIVTLQLLIANTQAHLLVLDVVRKRMIERNRPALKKRKTNSKVAKEDGFDASSRTPSSSSSNSSTCSSSSRSIIVDNASESIVSKSKDLSLENVSLLINPKFEMLTHFPQCIRDAGCDNSVRDTQLGELFMKLVRVIWGMTSKKYASVEYEMLKMYRNLQFLDIIKKGVQHRLGGVDVFTQKRTDKSKAYLRDLFLSESANYKFACNCARKQQSIQWNVQKGYYESEDGSCLAVHNILLDVSVFSFS